MQSCPSPTQPPIQKAYTKLQKAGGQSPSPALDAGGGEAAGTERQTWCPYTKSQTAAREQPKPERLENTGKFVFLQGVEGRLFWENKWTSFSNKCVLSIKARNKLFYLKKEEKKKIRYNQKIKPKLHSWTVLPRLLRAVADYLSFCLFSISQIHIFAVGIVLGNTQYTITITVTELISCI